MKRGFQPAFPRPHSWDEAPVTGRHEGDRPEPHGAQDGMTLREYYVGAILQGLCANPVVRVTIETLPGVAKLADDMLRVMNEPPPERTAIVVAPASALNGTKQ